MQSCYRKNSQAMQLTQELVSVSTQGANHGLYCDSSSSSVHTTNKHKAYLAKCRDDVKVLWCHSYLNFLVGFETPSLQARKKKKNFCDIFV